MAATPLKDAISRPSRAIPPPTNRLVGEPKHPQPGPATAHQVPPAEPPPPATHAPTRDTPRRQHSPKDGGPQATNPTPPKAVRRHTEPQPVPGRMGKNHRLRPHTPTQHNSRGDPCMGRAPSRSPIPPPAHATHDTPAHMVPQEPQTPPPQAPRRAHPQANPPGAAPPTPQAKATAPPPALRADRTPPTPNPTGEQAQEQRKGRTGQGDREQGERVAEKYASPQPHGPPRHVRRGQKIKLKQLRVRRTSRRNARPRRGTQTPGQPTQATPQAQGSPGLQFD
ncbi:proline-rich protein 2-like [Gouania willdenowi]|uniref:proline-rich protein 2-like n=1 Tax=Gouania willdenowi TaxID=441366 RepID=UPI0010558C37|nr:proline-rich protein 2-like [Gouania willdenowi]